LDPEDQEGEGIGVTRFFRDPNNAEWGEVAIVVIDAWQGSGIGSALLEALANHCLRTGVKGWRAAILGDNDRAVHTFEKFGKVVLREWEERSLVLHVELN
jgi:GNAT superfamily N-acetyltransferase